MNDGKEIIGLAHSLRMEVWGKAHAKWQQVERILDGNYTIEVPLWAKSPKIVPPTAWKMIHFASAQMISTMPSVHRRPMNNDEADRKLSQQIATWCALTLQNIGRNSTTNPFRDFFSNLNLYGYSVFYGPIPNYKLWDERYEAFTSENILPNDSEWARKSKAIMPFEVITPNPMSVLMDPNEGKNPTFGIWESQRPRATLERDFGINLADLGPMNRVQNWTPVETVTYADEQHLVMFLRQVPEKPIYVIENPLGYVPFTQAFSGLGLRRYNQGTAGVEYLAESLIQASQHTLMAETEAMTHFMAILRQVAWRTIFAKIGSGINEQTLGRHALIEVAEPKDAVEYSPIPEVPPWMMQILDIMRSASEGSTLSPTISGGTLPGVRTASQHGQAAASARLLYNPAMEQMNDASSIVMGNCGRMLAQLKQRWDGKYPMAITVEGMLEHELQRETISAEDFQDDYMFHINFEASDPMLQLAKREMAMNLRAQPLGEGGTPGISYETFISMLDIAGIDAETEMRILNDEAIVLKVMGDTGFWEAVKQAAAQERGVTPTQVTDPTAGALV